MWSSLHSTTSSHGIISSTTIAISHYHAMLQSNVFAVWHSLTQISMIKRTTSYMKNININRYHLYENDNDNDNNDNNDNDDNNNDNDNDDEFINKRRLSILMHPTSSLHKTVSMRDKIMHRLKQKNSPTSSSSSSSSRSRSPNEDLTYMFTEDIEDAVDAVDAVDVAKDIQDSQPYNVTSTGKKIILYLLNYFFCFFVFLFFFFFSFTDNSFFVFFSFFSNLQQKKYLPWVLVQEMCQWRYCVIFSKVLRLYVDIYWNNLYNMV